MGKVVKKVGKVLGKVAKVAFGIVGGMLFAGPKKEKASANAATETRLNVNLNPEENRKIVFGETALGTDLRFWETFGTKNERHIQVIAAAGHAIESFGNLYVDEYPVPLDPYEPVPGHKLRGALIRYVVTKGVKGAAPSFGSGTRWNASASFHGASFYVLEWIYTQEKLANGIPSRITQVGKGAKLYDPRRDGTRGGVGAHRADNPDTWEYSPLDSNGVAIGRNNALQMLTYQLGLFVRNAQTNALVLVGGRGVDPVDIDFASFIIAANICEVERWYSDCILSTGDDHSKNEGILEAAAGGELADIGGRFSYFVATNDTANAAVYLNENDIVGSIDWEPQPSISQQFNELPGSFVDPAALFQTRPLPLCWDQAYYDADGYKKRGGEMKLAAVQDANQGQKLLRIALNRTRFPGVFTAEFNMKALRLKKNSLVRLSFEPFAWVDKLFKVDGQGLSSEGGIELVLREYDASIYAPGAVVPVPAPSVGYGGDPMVEIATTGLNSLATGVVSGTSAVDAVQLTWDLPDQRVKHTEIRFKKTTDAAWQTVAPQRRDQNLATISPLLPSTAYTFEVRQISVWNVPGPWLAKPQATNAVTKNPAGAIVYADGTPVENLKPAGANANNTGANIAAGIAGQGPGATAAAGDVLNNALFGPNTNRVYFSDFDKGTEGWAVENSAGGNFFTGLNNYKYIRYQWTASAGQNVRIAEPNGYAFPVTPNERISVQARMQTATSVVGGIASSTLYINWLDANNVSVGNTTIFDKVGDMPTADIAAFVTVPSNAVKGRINSRLIMSAGGPFPDTNILLYRPMVASANASQTIHPPYSPGPGAVPGADVTGSNTAGAIVGQGPLATATYAYHAGNAAAIAAGLGVGQMYFNTLNGNALTSVVAGAAGLSVTQSTQFLAGSRVGPGQAQTFNNIEVNVAGGNAGATIRWIRLSGDARVNMNGPTSFTTGAYGSINAGEFISAYFMGVVSKDGLHASVYVQVDLNDSN